MTIRDPYAVIDLLRGSRLPAPPSGWERSRSTTPRGGRFCPTPSRKACGRAAPRSSTRRVLLSDRTPPVLPTERPYGRVVGGFVSFVSVISDLGDGLGIWPCKFETSRLTGRDGPPHRIMSGENASGGCGERDDPKGWEPIHQLRGQGG